MVDIQSVTISQTQSLSIQKSITASYERSEQAVGLQLSLGAAQQNTQDGFGGIFDVIDISIDAREKLLQDRRDAEALSAAVQGQGPQGIDALLKGLNNNGRIEIDASVAQVSERFSFSESYSLSFLQEATLEIETDEGTLFVTQSRLQEVELSSSITLERSASVGSLQAQLAA